MADSATILIPDISGYTEFLTKTELVHSPPRFHKQVKLIERDAVCQCGACRTASNLSLKFVAHHGVVQEIKVRQFTKCSGVDMIVAHRLLKNRIASNEYILATPSCLDFSRLPHSAGALAWERSSDEYPAIGTIHYQYAPLAGVRRTIADPPPRTSPVVSSGITPSQWRSMHRCCKCTSS